jgi:hypothetical protein
LGLGLGFLYLPSAAKDHNDWAFKTINTHLIMSSLRLALRLSLQESCSQNTTTAAAATPAKGKKAAVRIVTPPEKENVPPAAAPRKETIMSSLRIACRLSLQEICAPIITPTKGKKSAVRIVTPPEKENVPPAAAPRKETIEPPQQDKPPPHESRIFSDAQSFAEIAFKLQVPEKALHCVELREDGSVCGVDGCHYPAAAQNGTRGQNGGYRCVAHNQDWYPKNTCNRGHNLLGLRHLRGHGNNRRNKACCCDNATCLGIGYSEFNARVPKHQVENIVRALPPTTTW